MDITYNILKNYETEILPLIEGNPSIETFVQTVLDLANIQYTFTLMKNMNQEKADMIRQQSYQGLSEEEINIIKEYESRCEMCEKMAGCFTMGTL